MRNLVGLVSVFSMLLISACENASPPSAPESEAALPAQPAGAEVSAAFDRDVLPILQARCLSCHRPDGMAPMALTTYAETRPYAKAILEQLASADRFSEHPGALSIPPLDEASGRTLGDWARSELP